MNSLETKNSKRDRSLYVSLKLPRTLKERLDDVTIGDTAVYKKTAHIRYLLTEFFHARDSGRKVINLAID